MLVLRYIPICVDITNFITVYATSTFSHQSLTFVKKKTSENDKNNIFLFSCWLKFDKPVTYTMLRKIFVYALIYAVVVFTFTNASLNSGNTITKYQLANTNNTVPDRWKIVIGYYMYQYCIYVGNSGTYNLELWFSNH